MQVHCQYTETKVYIPRDANAVLQQPVYGQPDIVIPIILC